jgi:hypothetical protein
VATFDDVRRVLSDVFATTDSESVQHTLYTKGSAVLGAHPEVGWVRPDVLIPLMLTPVGAVLFVLVERRHVLLHKLLE